MYRGRGLARAIFISLGIAVGLGGSVLPAPARAQVVYQCPPGYYYYPDYGCVPQTYFYEPPYYAYPDFGFGLFYGGHGYDRGRGEAPRGGGGRGGGHDGHGGR